jgi:hypothetical protein
MKLEARKLGMWPLCAFVVLLPAWGCENRHGERSGPKEPAETGAKKPLVATSSPVEAWVLSDKQAYHPGGPVQLTLKLVNRAQQEVRLPVPVVDTESTGWGVLKLDLFVNGRKYRAECQTPDVVQIESNGEVAWRVIMSERQWPPGQPPWGSPGHYTVYSVWQRTDVSAQTDNDFLGPIVSHPAEYDVVSSKEDK